jgi:ABC-type nitrate/sulfonate/bicarbonate transport system ATPase subunit
MSYETSTNPPTPTVQAARQTDDGTGAPTLLSVDHLRYSYPAQRSQAPVLAVEDVSLAIRPGTITSIVGPSGCGKSTLLSLIAGLQPPDSGDVRWTPSDTAGLVAKKQRLFTMVFQKDTVLPWLKVDANIGWGLRYLHMTAAERDERITQLLELVGLSDFRKSYPYQLSGGMRRRVAFLSGVAPMPQVMLLDEPFSALDEPTRVNIHVEVMRIVAELGMAVILVTHDLSEAITMSDRVVILTKRPARVAKTFDLPFGRDRDVRALRETDEYQQFYKTLWHELNVQSGLATPVGAS